MTDKSPAQIKRARLIINVLSVVIPLAVAVLFKVEIKGVDTSMLPPIYAGINALTAVLLIGALIAIKKGNRVMHENLMRVAMVCSLLFLLMYVIYHMTSESTEYGGDGAMKSVYYFVLISHIVLSVAVVPLVLYSFLRAWIGDFPAHKKLVKYAYPVWLYVAITGVVVYLMISPYYS